MYHDAFFKEYFSLDGFINEVKTDAKAEMILTKALVPRYFYIFSKGGDEIFIVTLPYFHLMFKNENNFTNLSGFVDMGYVGLMGAAKQKNLTLIASIGILDFYCSVYEDKEVELDADNRLPHGIPKPSLDPNRKEAINVMIYYPETTRVYFMLYKRTETGILFEKEITDVEKFGGLIAKLFPKTALHE